MADEWLTRLAYTGAETFVATASTGNFDWLRQRLGDLLGPAYPEQLAESRSRLNDASAEARTVELQARTAEVQAWGERLGDALRDRPELAIQLRSVVDEASVRLLVTLPQAAVSGPTPRTGSVVPAGSALRAESALTVRSAPLRSPSRPAWRIPRPVLLAAVVVLLVAAGVVAALSLAEPQAVDQIRQPFDWRR